MYEYSILHSSQTSASGDIPISKNGTSPDFNELTQYLYKNNSDFGKVKIKVTGSRDKDFKQAFEQIGITDKSLQEIIKEDYVWHHLDDLDENLGGTMQLVLREAHEATLTHLGSAAQFQNLFNITEKYL